MRGLPLVAVLLGFSDPKTQFALKAAIDGARMRLAVPACQEVLSDFGLPRGADVVAAFDALRYQDSRDVRYCDRALAFTMIGSRVVHVCGPRFKELMDGKMFIAEVILIHEFLHSRGLGENPPSSSDITAQVRKRCGTRG